MKRTSRRYLRMPAKDQQTVGDYIAAIGRGDSKAMSRLRPRYQEALKRTPKKKGD